MTLNDERHQVCQRLLHLHLSARISNLEKAKTSHHLKETRAFRSCKSQKHE